MRRKKKSKKILNKRDLFLCASFNYREILSKIDLGEKNFHNIFKSLSYFKFMKISENDL